MQISDAQWTGDRAVDGPDGELVAQDRCRTVQRPKRVPDGVLITHAIAPTTSRISTAMTMPVGPEFSSAHRSQVRPEDQVQPPGVVAAR